MNCFCPSIFLNQIIVYTLQEILDKFEGSNNQTQKEKFEADLKKEIKRLQRFRDQIKTWHTSNDIKDKRPLIEARKLIEQDMERFKVIEKETKTKAYSKEGLLSADAKKDPLQKEKEELDEWLKQSISDLQTKSEKYEYALETLSTTGKKKRVDKERVALLEEMKQKLEFCAFHIEKLETVMRLLDNERLDCSKVRSLKESIKYMIESLDEANMDDYRSLYEDLHLEELGDGSIMTPNSLIAPGFLDYDMNPTSNISSVTKIGNVDDSMPFSPTLLPGSSASSNASSSRERPKTTSDEKCVFAPASLSSTSTPIKEKKEKNSKSQPSSAAVNQTLPPSFHLAESSNTAPLNRKSFAGAASKSHVHEYSKSESERPVVSIMDTMPIQRENYAKVASESKKDKPKKEQQLQLNDPASLKHENKKDDDEKERAPSSDSNTVITKPHSPTRSASTIADTSVDFAVSSSIPLSQDLAPTISSAPIFSIASTSHVSSNVIIPTETSPPLARMQRQQQEHQPSHCILVHPRDALAPFRNALVDKQRNICPEVSFTNINFQIDSCLGHSFILYLTAVMFANFVLQS